MWCGVILTAVALSYVVCVLLLSGLQKEDLDANTLEKLRRHNVNIYDMNNESLHQECLSNSYSDMGNGTQEHKTMENQNLGIAAPNKSDIRNVLLADYIKLSMRVPEHFEEKTNVKTTNAPENSTPEGFLKQLLTINENLKTNDIKDNLDNVTKIEENNGLEIEYMPNQPALQSVMNFWTKLTHNTKKVLTKIATTSASPNINEEKKVTTIKDETSYNNGYVHSREMEFISRILAEYLANQTIPTTTQRVSAKKEYINMISKKLSQLFKNKIIDEETDSVFSAKNIDQTLNDNYLQKVNNFTEFSEELSPILPTKNNEQSTKYLIGKENNYTQVDVFPREVHADYITNEPSGMQYEVLYDNHQLIQNKQDTAHPLKVNNDYDMTDETEGMPTKFKTFNNNKNIKRIHDSPYKSIRFSMNTENPKEINENFPVRFLNNLLRINSEFKINGLPISYTKATTKSNKLLINKNSEQQESSETFKRYKIVKYIMPNANYTNYNNLDRNQNVTMKNDHFQGVPTEKNELGPIRNYRMNNKQFKAKHSNKKETDQGLNYEITNDKLKVMAIMKSSEQARNFGKKGRNQNPRMNTGLSDLPPDINKSEQIQKNYKDNSLFRIIPADIKRSKVNQNFEMDTDKTVSTEIDKPENAQNLGMYDNQFQSRLAKTQKVDFRDKINPELNINLGFKDNHFKIIPALTEMSDQVQDSTNQLQIMAPKNSAHNQNFVINSEQLQSIQADVNNLKQISKYGMNINDPQAIPANIINEIAEKVKQIVLNDMRKESPKTTVKASSYTSTQVTTTTTKLTPTTTNSTGTTSEKPSTLHKDMKEANHVMLKLMEMFNEFKAMKETVKSTTDAPLKVAVNNDTTNRKKMPIQTYPPALDALNPYIIKTPRVNVKPSALSSNGSSIIPTPVSSLVNLPRNKNQVLQNEPLLNFQQRKEYRSAAITIQTNAEEIAPLAIQISKPMKLVNQHIVVTTKSPSENRKDEGELERKNRIDEKYRGPSATFEVKNHKEKLKIHSDVAKRGRFADNLKKHEYRDRYSFKDRFNKDREKSQYSHEFSERLIQRGRSRYPGSSSYLGSPSYPASPSNPGSPSYPGSSSYPGTSSHHDSISHTGDSSRMENLRHRWGLTHFGGFNRPVGGHQDGRSHPSGSYGYNEHERPHPRYEATKFHEKLEGIENWPRNTWKGNRAVSKGDCCEEIPARQQMPLTKTKQSMRFDNTHFTNFLKSQQKVTDMLEKILAHNIRSDGPNSVETP